jgi:hypothetical protein
MIEAFSGHDRIAAPLWLIVVLAAWALTTWARRLFLSPTTGPAQAGLARVVGGMLFALGLLVGLAGLYGLVRSAIFNR